MAEITVGRIVHYKLNQWDADAVKEREGAVLPMIVCRVWPHEYGTGVPGVNGQVFLDGRDTLWVTSVREGTEPGTWQWPPRV